MSVHLITADSGERLQQCERAYTSLSTTHYLHIYTRHIGITHNAHPTVILIYQLSLNLEYRTRICF